MACFEALQEAPSAPKTCAPEVIFEELIPAPMDAACRAKLHDAVRGGVSDADLDAALAVFDGDPFAVEPEARVLALAIRNHALYQRLTDAIARHDGPWAEYLIRSGADYGGSTEVLAVLNAKAVAQLRRIVSEGMCRAIDRALARAMD
jgi:hypothetical protein